MVSIVRHVVISSHLSSSGSPSPSASPSHLHPSSFPILLTNSISSADLVPSPPSSSFLPSFPPSFIRLIAFHSTSSCPCLRLRPRPRPSSHHSNDDIGSFLQFGFGGNASSKTSRLRLIGTSTTFTSDAGKSDGSSVSPDLASSIFSFLSLDFSPGFESSPRLFNHSIFPSAFKGGTIHFGIESLPSGRNEN